MMTRRRSGFTLVEVVVTIGLLAVIALGAMSYQFHATKKTKVAWVKMSATRLALLVLENWKIQGGDAHYDPTVLHPDAEAVPNTTLYLFRVDEVPFYLALSASDIDSNEDMGVTLRELSVAIQWQADYQAQRPGTDDPGTTFHTYVRRDQSGG